MPNSYYTRTMNPQPTQRVGSNDIKSEFQSVTSGFDAVAADVTRAVKLPVGTSDQTIGLSPASRANLVLAFDASGNISAIAYGRYRGDWLTAASYVVGDYFRDPVSKNIYAVILGHTSGVLAADIAANKVQLAINVADVEAAKTAAEEAAATATAQASIAIAQADAARTIANFVGLWSTLTGPLNKPATVYHNGLYYALLNNLANVAASEPGVSSDWVASGGVQIIAYADRGTLRSSAGTMAIIDGLWLFSFVGSSDEPDDDESCFATSTGRWLLEAAHWDLVDAWQLPDDDARDVWDENEGLRVDGKVAASTASHFAANFASSFANKVLTGSATCAVTSVATVASAAFTGTVTGAAVGDRVIATPPAALGSTDAESGKLSCHAWVSAANTVTVRLTNASAAAAATNDAIQTAWPITVVKS